MGRERTACRIELEDGDVVARHVCAQKPPAVRGDEKVLGALAPAGLDVEEGEGAVVGDLVAGQTVVTAVGAVEVLAVGGDF